VPSDAAPSPHFARLPFLLQHRLHSLNSRDICYLNVNNSTPHAVRMLWLDYQGNEVSSSSSSTLYTT
jgi:hypothetical protein